MENLNLVAELRAKEEILKEVRASKMVPGVVYWHKQETISIKVDYSSLLKTYRKSGKNHLINLDVEWKNIEVLVHEVQKEPVSWDFLHIDFYAITKGEKLTTIIPLEFVGNSPAVKEWAILEEHIKELEVKCLPKDLVDNFEVNLAILKEMWDVIRVSDLNIDSNKYDIHVSLDNVVVTAAKPAKINIEETTVETTEEK